MSRESICITPFPLVPVISRRPRREGLAGIPLGHRRRSYLGSKLFVCGALNRPAGNHLARHGVA